MPQEYPKALYTGDQTNYEMSIAQGVEDEQLLRDSGHVDFADLPESSPEMKYASGGGANTISPSALVPVEQFDALALKVAELEQENAELSKKLRIKELEDTSADDLKALLTERNVTFGARDTKAVLLNLVIESDGGE